MTHDDAQPRPAVDCSCTGPWPTFNIHTGTRLHQPDCALVVLVADLAQCRQQLAKAQAWAKDEQAKRHAAEDARVTARSEAAFMADVVTAARASLAEWTDFGDIEFDDLQRALARLDAAQPEPATTADPPTMTGYRLCSAPVLGNAPSGICGGSHWTRDHERVMAIKRGEQEPATSAAENRFPLCALCGRPGGWPHELQSHSFVENR